MWFELDWPVLAMYDKRGVMHSKSNCPKKLQKFPCLWPEMQLLQIEQYCWKLMGLQVPIMQWSLNKAMFVVIYYFYYYYICCCCCDVKSSSSYIYWGLSVKIWGLCTTFYLIQTSLLLCFHSKWTPIIWLYIWSTKWVFCVTNLSLNKYSVNLLVE